jgi:hypothetical protein
MCAGTPARQRALSASGGAGDHHRDRRRAGLSSGLQFAPPLKPEDKLRRPGGSARWDDRFLNFIRSRRRFVAGDAGDMVDGSGDTIINPPNLPTGSRRAIPTQSVFHGNGILSVLPRM